MGRIKQGVLGGFSGKVGTVVGAHWKGIAYMRSLPEKTKIKRPPTQKQKEQQAKFAMVQRFLQPLTPVLRLGYKLEAEHRTPFNAAMAQVLHDAITGTYPDYALDHSKILLSKGTLPQAANQRFTHSAYTATLTWEDNTGEGESRADDKAIVVYYSTLFRLMLYSIGEATRQDQTIDIVTPQEWWQGESLIYMGFVSQDGLRVSNSKFLGRKYRNEVTTNF